MKLSFITPTFNKASYLRALLESICRMDFPRDEVEVIVINDGSTDRTVEVLRSFQTRLPHFHFRTQSNQGISAARNAGLALATGELVVFFADDYELPPDFYRKMVPLFDDPTVLLAKPLLGVKKGNLVEQVNLFLYTHHMADCFFPERLPMPSHLTSFRFPTVPTRYAHTTDISGGTMMRRSLFNRFTAFRLDLATGEDTELGNRFAQTGIKPILQPQVTILIRFRKHLLSSVHRHYTYGKSWCLIHNVLSENHMYVPKNFFRLILFQLHMIRYAIRLCLYAGTWRRFFAYLPYVYLHLVAARYGMYREHYRRLKVASLTEQTA